MKLLGYMFLSFVVVLAGTYVYVAMSPGKPAARSRLYEKENPRPLVIAHRGGAGLAPENTLAAFRRSAELGADILEIDIRRTLDGELVVIHDSKVDRTTNGSGEVAEMMLAELKKLDAGFRWTNDGGNTFPFRGSGITIPTLREVFEAFPEKIINIEPKFSTPSPAIQLCTLIEEFKRSDKVIVGTFRDEVLEEFRAICPSVATSASPSEAIYFLAQYQIGLSESYSPEMQFFQIPSKLRSWEIVTEDYVRALHERNLDVHVWTINDSEEMKRLIELKVDGIMTDKPDLLIETLSSVQ
ncbi:MAG: glycerophosphodiester phosphodiesterase [Pyrinomonadaceae bacterium]|nr:glycerophosphodiester phosphodiesterase [Pyrinomonadaceae bacterium]